MQQMKASHGEYFHRSASELAHDLPGNCLRTKAGVFVVSLVEAFNGLVRKSMQDDYDRADREPGDICVTNFRGWPQLNVVGQASTGKPQLTWMQEFMEGEEPVKGASLVQATAAAHGERVKGAQILEYALDALDGKNLQDSKSPIRIAENTDLPLTERKVSFHRHAGTAENSAGVGVLVREFTEIPDPVQLDRLLADIAREVKMDPKDLLKPQNLVPALQKSRRFRSLIQHFAQEG